MFANSRNFNQLKHAWREWRKVSGAKYRKQYLDFIALNNEGAKSLGYNIYNLYFKILTHGNEYIVLY